MDFSNGDYLIWKQDYTERKLHLSFIRKLMKAGASDDFLRAFANGDLKIIIDDFLERVS